MPMRPDYQKILNFPLGLTGIYGFAIFAPLSIAFSQISIGLTLAGWILLILRDKKLNWKKTPLDIPILIYVLIQILAALFSRHILTGFKVWLNTDWFILFFYAVIHLLIDEKHYKKILLLLAVSGAISGIYGVIQHFVGIDYVRGLSNIWPYGLFHRATGFFDLPLTYGGVQLCLLWLFFPFYFLKNRFLDKRIILLLLFILLLSILASYARSAWLGLGGALVLLLFFLDVVPGEPVALYFLHPQLLFDNGIVSMFDASDNAPYNNLVRIRLWQSSLNLIRDNWLLGVGYSDFYQIFGQYKVPFDYRGLSDPHNIYLKVICHSGILGGLAYINLWFQDLRKIYQTYKPAFFKDMTLLKAGSIGSFFAVFSILVAGLTQEYYYDQENAELWWFIAAIGIIGILRRKSEP